MVTTCKNNSLLCVCVGGVSCFCPSIAPVYIICKSDLQIMKLFFFCKLLTQYSTPVCIGAACNLSNRVSSQPTYTPASFIKSRGTGPHLVTSPANKTADSFCHQRGALQQVRVLTFFGQNMRKCLLSECIMAASGNQKSTRVNSVLPISVLPLLI